MKRPESHSENLRRYAGTLILVVTVLLTSPAVAQTDYQSVINTLERDIRKTLRKERIAGITIALIDDQELIWYQPFGHRNMKSREPLPAKATFDTGELSKLITGIAVLQMVSKGQVELDKPVSDYLPDLKWIRRDPAWPEPTVRQLLTHHGGLPVNRLAGSFLEKPAETLPDISSTFLAQRPGIIYMYSDLGYTILAKLIEEVSDKPYTQYVQEKILTPLGMDEAGFAPGDNQALGHNQKRRIEKPLYARDLGALGLHASTLDFAKFTQWFLKEDTRPVLPRRWVDEMQRLQNQEIPLDLDNQTGLAWQLTNVNQHPVDRVLRLTSATLQFRAYLLMAPDERLGVVMFSNSENAGEEFFDLAPKALDLMLEAKLNRQAVKTEDGIPESVATPGRAKSDQLQQAYTTALGAIEFDGKADNASMDFIGRRFRVKERADGWYTVSYRLFGLIDLRFSFLKDVLLQPAVLDNFNVLLAYYQGSVFLLGTAFTDNPTDPGLANLTGKYRLTNPDVLTEQLKLKQIELTVENGQLFVSYRLPLLISLRPKIPLNRLDENTFYLPGLGTNLGDRLMVEQSDEGYWIEYSGYRFKQIN